jgi:hypothetical protein
VLDFTTNTNKQARTFQTPPISHDLLKEINGTISTMIYHLLFYFWKPFNWNNCKTGVIECHENVWEFLNFVLDDP